MTLIFPFFLLLSLNFFDLLVAPNQYRFRPQKNLLSHYIIIYFTGNITHYDKNFMSYVPALQLLLQPHINS
jgi:hypothetical protein